MVSKLASPTLSSSFKDKSQMLRASGVPVGVAVSHIRTAAISLKSPLINQLLLNLTIQAPKSRRA